MSNAALEFRAGPGAYREIREHGFSPDRIGTVAAASGGAKWLVLSHLDRVVIERILPALTAPVHLVGSSIGAWRMACYARENPLRAVANFESSYLEQTYSDNPDTEEITASMRASLDRLLGDDGASEIAGNERFRTHILTVRSRMLVASDNKHLLRAGLLAAAGANFVIRRSLGAFFRRAIFYDRRDPPPFHDVRGFPVDHIELNEANVADAVIASSAVPLVISGVRGIAGAPPGTYRDGGIIDYHLDLPLSDNGRLTLYPHFFNRLTPGWFDKRLHWRKFKPEHYDCTILICPSDEFIAGLPNGKVPDRSDFMTMSQTDRIRCWKQAVADCRRLADELDDVLANDRLAAVLEPL